MYFIFTRYLSEIYLSKIYQVIFVRILLCVMIYKYNIYEFIRYLVHRKEQNKIRGKSRPKIGRKYQINQIIKKMCYL